MLAAMVKVVSTTITWQFYLVCWGSDCLACASPGAATDQPGVQDGSQTSFSLMVSAGGPPTFPLSTCHTPGPTEGPKRPN
jgi:hypothetical protein